MTKEQLQNYKALEKEKHQIEQKLCHLEKHPNTEEEVLRPLRERYTAKMDELVKAQLAIEEAIGTLNSRERQLVRLRYIDGLPWHRVAFEINYSEPQAKRIGQKVLKKLEKL